MEHADRKALSWLLCAITITNSLQKRVTNFDSYCLFLVSGFQFLVSPIALLSASLVLLFCFQPDSDWVVVVAAVAVAAWWLENFHINVFWREKTQNQQTGLKRRIKIQWFRYNEDNPNCWSRALTHNFHAFTQERSQNATLYIMPKCNKHIKLLAQFKYPHKMKRIPYIIGWLWILCKKTFSQKSIWEDERRGSKKEGSTTNC